MNNTTPSVRPREKRTLHFDLSHAQASMQHTLNLGFAKHRLEPHTEKTRREHRKDVQLLNHIPDSQLTHYVSLDLPSDAIQSFWISSSKHGAEMPGMALAGIHVPKAAVAAHQKKKGLATGVHQTKAAQLGLLEVSSESNPSWMDNGDLADFVNLSDAAKFVIFHHPEVMSFEPSTAAEALSKIESTRGFAQLVQAMGNAGAAVGPESDYTGWATGDYILDLEGNPIPVTDLSKPLDQQPIGLGFQWAYDYDETVKAAMTPVVQQTLRLMRDDPEMEGVSFQTTYGIHVFDEGEQVSAEASTEGDPARVRRFSVKPSLAATSGYEFAVDNPGWGNGFKVDIVSTSGRQLKLKVQNSFYLYRAAYVRFLAQDGTPIKLADLPDSQRPSNRWNGADSDWDSYQSVIKPRQRILGIPVEASSSLEFTVTMPDDAAFMEVVMASPSTHPDVPATYGGLDVPAQFQTYLLCYGMPTFLLMLGIGTAVMFQAPVAVMIEQLVSDLVEAAANPLIQLASNSKQSAADIGAYFWSIMPRFGGEIAAGFASIIIYYYAVAVANPANYFPLMKAVMLAVMAAAVAAEMIETTINLSETPRIAKRKISALIPVEVTVGHDVNDYQFPEAATHYKITVTPNGATPSVFEGDLASPKIESLKHTFTVTAGGQITVEAQFTDPVTGWVGAHGIYGPVPNLLEDGNDKIAIAFNVTENLVPLERNTSYRHVEKLGYNNGRHVWVPTSTPPSSTIRSLGGNTAVSLSDLDHITINMKGRLGYVWRGSSPALFPVDGRQGGTQLHTLQSIGLEGNDPDQFLRILGTRNEQFGYSQPIFLQYDLTGDADGYHICVAPRSVGGKWEYHVHRISLNDSGPIDVTIGPSWGRFASTRISDVAVHPSGIVIALNSEAEKVELLRMPAAPTGDPANAPLATQLSGQGSYIGLLHGAKAVSITGDGNTFLVLEQVNGRIQAFSVNSASVNYFDVPGHNQRSYMILNQGLDYSNVQVTYLDMSLEYGGYIYVLSYTGSGDNWQDYRMDIYEPNGKFLTRVQGVPAAKLVVDKWRVVYTENFELLEGPLQRPEPTVSAWAARAGA